MERTIRDLSHVNKEEWELLQHWGKDTFVTTSTQHQTFQTDLTQSLHTLFSDVLQLPFPDADADKSQPLSSFKVFSYFVVELSSEVSMILVLPSLPQAILGPSVTSPLVDNPKMKLTPMKCFEETNAYVYANGFTKQFGRLASLLESLNFVVTKHDRISASQGQTLAPPEDCIRETLAQMETQLQKTRNRIRWLNLVVNCIRRDPRSGRPC
jgi:hypothetical protein